MAIEAEVTEFLGRDRYGRGERSREGRRNGYSPITIKTTAGPVTLEKPKRRANTEPFASRLLGIGVTRPCEVLHRDVARAPGEVMPRLEAR